MVPKIFVKQEKVIKITSCIHVKSTLFFLHFLFSAQTWTSWYGVILYLKLSWTCSRKWCEKFCEFHHMMCTKPSLGQRKVCCQTWHPGGSAHGSLVLSVESVKEGGLPLYCNGDSRRFAFFTLSRQRQPSILPTQSYPLLTSTCLLAVSAQLLIQLQLLFHHSAVAWFPYNNYIPYFGE